MESREAMDLVKPLRVTHCHLNTFGASTGGTKINLRDTCLHQPEGSYQQRGPFSLITR